MARFAQRLGLTRFEADEYYKQALQAYSKKKLNDAILAMEQAIEWLPNNAEYHATRGFFYLEDGVVQKAEDDFEKALQIYPYETLAHYGRGVIAYKSKNWEEALAHFTDAYRSNPKRPETLYYLALVHHHQRQNEQALPYMEQAQAIFVEAGDRRKSDAGKWVREIKKIIKQSK